MCMNWGDTVRFFPLQQTSRYPSNIFHSTGTGELVSAHIESAHIGSFPPREPLEQNIFTFTSKKCTRYRKTRRRCSVFSLRQSEWNGSFTNNAFLLPLCHFRCGGVSYHLLKKCLHPTYSTLTFYNNMSFVYTIFLAFTVKSKIA